MFKANTDIIRSTFIGKTLKEKLIEKDLTMSEIAEKINSTQPLISRSLNGKVVSSDNLFTKIGKGIGLSDREIKEIFKEADREEYKYKYGEEPCENTSSENINFDVALRKEYGQDIDEDTIGKIKSFIEHVKFMNK